MYDYDASKEPYFEEVNNDNHMYASSRKFMNLKLSVFIEARHDFPRETLCHLFTKVWLVFLQWIEDGLVSRLEKSNMIPEHIGLFIKINRLSVSKFSKLQLWPILGMLEFSKILIAIFSDTEKNYRIFA